MLSFPLYGRQVANQSYKTLVRSVIQPMMWGRWDGFIRFLRSVSVNECNVSDWNSNPALWDVIHSTKHNILHSEIIKSKITNVNCRGFIFEWARRCDVLSLKPLYILKRPLTLSCIFYLFQFQLFFSYVQMEDSFPVQNKEKSGIDGLQGCCDKRDVSLIPEPLKDRTFRSNAFFPSLHIQRKKWGYF